MGVQTEFAFCARLAFGCVLRVSGRRRFLNGRPGCIVWPLLLSVRMLLLAFGVEPLLMPPSFGLLRKLRSAFLTGPFLYPQDAGGEGLHTPRPPCRLSTLMPRGNSGILAGAALSRQFEMQFWGARFARASRRAFQAFLRTALELQGVFGGALFCAAWVRLSHYFAAGAYRQAPFTDMGRPKRGASGIFLRGGPGSAAGWGAHGAIRG